MLAGPRYRGIRQKGINSCGFTGSHPPQNAAEVRASPGRPACFSPRDVASARRGIAPRSAFNSRSLQVHPRNAWNYLAPKKFHPFNPRTHEAPRHVPPPMEAAIAPQLLPRGSVQDAVQFARAACLIFSISTRPAKRASVPLPGFRIPLSQPRAITAHFLVEARKSRLYAHAVPRSASSLRCGSSVILAAMAFALARKNELAVLCNQVGNPAKDDSEVGQRKKISRCESAGILHRAFGSQRRNRCGKKVKSAVARTHGTPPTLIEAVVDSVIGTLIGLPRGARRSGRREPRQEWFRQFRPPARALACSSCTRAAPLPRQAPLCGLQLLLAAASAPAVTDACRSSGRGGGSVSCSTKISPRALPQRFVIGAQLLLHGSAGSLPLPDARPQLACGARRERL